MRLRLLTVAVASLLVSLPAQLFAQTAETKPATAPAADRWEKEIAAYEAQDQMNPPAPGGIVFVGSSSIRLWKSLADDFPQHRVLNRGFGGSEIADSVRYADRIVIPYQPRMVVMYAGGNDINKGKTPTQVFADFRAFFTKVRTALPEAEIAYISIAGNPKRWSQVEQVKETNNAIAGFLKEQPRAHFINVFPRMLGEDGLPLPHIFRDDRLHMNDDGYRIWRDVIGPYLPRPDKP